MKIKTERDKRTYLIIALCAILVVMGAGYAAFSSLLTINGTANISNSWNIKITNIRAVNPCTFVENSVYANTESKTELLSSTIGSPNIKRLASSDYNCPSDAYDKSAPTHTDTTATFNTGLIKPGDERIYEVEVKNLGSIDAEITKTLINNVNSDAIVFSYDGVSETPEQIISENDEYNKENLDTNEPFELVSGGTKYIYITVGYNSSVTSQPNNLTANITVELDATQKEENSQDSGSSQATGEEFTGTIYRNNINQVAIGDLIVPENVIKYIITDGQKEKPFGLYKTQKKCETALESLPPGLSCQQKSVTTEGVGEYTTNPSTLNKAYYLKHDVVDDEITASYVCFVYNNEEHCMKGGDGGASFAANTQMIQDYQTFYNLGNYDDNTERVCNFNSLDSICYGGGFSQVSATSDGYLEVFDSSSGGCFVNIDGSSSCE